MDQNLAMGGESQSSKAPSPMEVVDLPPLPPRQGKNTPHIYRSDIETYLHPLISHRWTIGHVHKGQGIREILSLNKHFEFSSFAAAMEFVNGVAAISESERHHARTLIEYKTVVTFLHTHSAHIDFGIPGGKPNLRKVPGLTRRDIRLAIKIEQLHDEFMADGRAAPYAFRALGVLQKWACQLLKRRYGSDGFGGAAGSQPPFQKMIERMKARGEWNPLFSSQPVHPTIDPGENDPGAKPVR
ncbi:hypothetical protein BV22DRAFT_605137 [Leucogyrophana mollusca]|uniref:Uncharacterized protein n=1 Tax=Leucogyrophana mollusca TaxID=85980 RepID=A0ACB8BD04_9AGAM|nr:hypothetical protein BV22DRAFT_605137 [Leucogyrophana mollusca]